MRFKMNRRTARRAPGGVPRQTRTEVSQALCGVIGNRVVQFEQRFTLRLVSSSKMSRASGRERRAGLACHHQGVTGPAGGKG